jgi:hypothetical protein
VETYTFSMPLKNKGVDNASIKAKWVISGLPRFHSDFNLHCIIAA